MLSNVKYSQYYLLFLYNINIILKLLNQFKSYENMQVLSRRLQGHVKYFLLPLDGVSFAFLRFSLRVVVQSPKIAINLHRNYEKLHCKGEPYRFGGQRDPSAQTDRQTSCYFIIRILISTCVDAPYKIYSQICHINVKIQVYT